ncbi:BTB/POZ domain-containing protein [Aspergillus fijiensis CBS 313.89]|uniref:BTB domain-containing protein n=1 Tax=Aspergillus fijiensis CBS 313.89 TaxID=1448319 RepID=A0A8G1RXX0_9EURO|nr:uncharacterized protein BO72DRAFT_525220 [Aspergillus fijiensis CBS 313.89]RAK80318.1 hypothetical protein BO72DRAFT_525220 [Aspergillus fijiensis CBS 313.89]
MSTSPDEPESADCNEEYLCRDVTSRLLPLYHGPQVTIRLGSDGPTYMLSKALLCKKSTYFSKMFEGNYAEARTSFATLQEDTITFKPSFELYIEWLYLGKLTLPGEDRSNQITCLLKLARFAEMSGEGELTDLVTASIIQVITEAPEIRKKRNNPFPAKYRGINVKHIDVGHLAVVEELPRWNAVRRVLIMALVEPYLRAQPFIFSEELVLFSELAVDLLAEVKETMLAAVPRSGRIWITDPLTQIEVPLK